MGGGRDFGSRAGHGKDGREQETGTLSYAISWQGSRNPRSRSVHAFSFGSVYSGVTSSDWYNVAFLADSDSQEEVSFSRAGQEEFNVESFPIAT